MKKQSMLLAILFILLSFVMIACNPAPAEPTTYKVTLVYNNGTTDKVEEVDSDSEYKLPEVPAKEGYKFKAWYLDGKEITQWPITIEKDITLTAHWIKCIASESDFEKINLPSICEDANFSDDAANLLDGEYVLVEDIVLEHMLYVPENATAIFDFNGHKIESKFVGFAIGNWGNLTINDSSAKDDSFGDGLIYNSSKSNLNGNYGHDAIRNFGSLVINGGRFGDQDRDFTNKNDINYGASLRNIGTATINGGYFTCVDNYGQVLNPDGSNATHVNDKGQTVNTTSYSYAIRSQGTLHIKNAHIYGSMNGGISADAGTITIENGIYELNDTNGKTPYYVLVTNKNKSGKIIVKNGNFICNGGSSSLNLIGGFSGMPSWDASEKLEENGYTILGGTFSKNGEEVTF